MTDALLRSKAPTAPASDDTEGMNYLESLPRRLVTLYLPLFIILVVLLFPFYWMGLTAIKPDEQLIDMQTYNPFWVVHPTSSTSAGCCSRRSIHDGCGTPCM